MAPRKKKEEIKEEKVEKVKKEEKVEKVENQREEPKKKKSIFRYFIGFVFVFSFIDIVLMSLAVNLTSIVENYRFGSEILLELFYGLLALVVMLLFKNSYVFTGKKEKFFKSVFLGAPMLFLSVVILAINSLEIKTFDSVTVISCLLYCMLIGITEEFLCRGWVLNEFLERYGESKKNVILSIVLSSIVFGAMHITNAFGTGQSLYQTILQIINAVACGFLFGSLYYKTKNIWSVAFLHAFYDFALFIGEIESVNNCIEGVVTSKVVLVECISLAAISIFWILSSILVLKKTHFPDVNATRSNKIYFLIIPFLAISCVVALLPYDKFVEEYADYNVCYTYDTYTFGNNFVLNIPYYDRYTIHIDDNENKLMMDENQNIYEVAVKNEYNIQFELKENKLIITNSEINAFKEIDNVNDFFILEDKDEYKLVVLINDSKDGTIAKYSNYIKKNNINNSETYLEDIVNSLNKVNIPEVSFSGYVKIEEENYIFFTTTDKDQFVLIDDEVFLVK